MGYIEGVLIFLIAFIIIGPKDFPKIMGQIGDFWKRLRLLTDSFHDHWEKLGYTHLETEALALKDRLHDKESHKKTIQEHKENTRQRKEPKKKTKRSRNL